MQEIIDSNVVPRLIQLLELSTMTNIQYEAAWCITNIATGSREQVQCLTEKGAIPRLIALMNSENDNLKEQVILDAFTTLIGDMGVRKCGGRKH